MCTVQQHLRKLIEAIFGRHKTIVNEEKKDEDWYLVIALMSCIHVSVTPPSLYGYAADRANKNPNTIFWQKMQLKASFLGLSFGPESFQNKNTEYI